MGVGRRRPTAKPYLDALEANQAIDAGSGLTSLAGLPHGEFGDQAEPHRGDTCHLESGRPLNHREHRAIRLLGHAHLHARNSASVSTPSAITLIPMTCASWTVLATNRRLR